MTLAIIVSSAREGLTSVFGMGTGVSPPALPPENIFLTKIIPSKNNNFQHVFDNRRE
jgi:hypothetical protein